MRSSKCYNHHGPNRTQLLGRDEWKLKAVERETLVGEGGVVNYSVSFSVAIFVLIPTRIWNCKYEQRTIPSVRETRGTATCAGAALPVSTGTETLALAAPYDANSAASRCSSTRYMFASY
jgi:hypothetical protein